MVALMYLFSALDRGNVSNAKSDGMEWVHQIRLQWWIH